MTRDPVCGMKVNSRTSNLVSEYNGKTYYFCSDRCMKAFNTNPSQYLERKQSQNTSHNHSSMGGCCGGMGMGNKWTRYLFIGIMVYYLVTILLR
jgi:Cu+-exporting ATPase